VDSTSVSLFKECHTGLMTELAFLGEAILEVLQKLSDFSTVIVSVR